MLARPWVGRNSSLFWDAVWHPVGFRPPNRDRPTDIFFFPSRLFPDCYYPFCVCAFHFSSRSIACCIYLHPISSERFQTTPPWIHQEWAEFGSWQCSRVCFCSESSDRDSLLEQRPLQKEMESKCWRWRPPAARSVRCPSVGSELVITSSGGLCRVTVDVYNGVSFQ